MNGLVLMTLVWLANPPAPAEAAFAVRPVGMTVNAPIDEDVFEYSPLMGPQGVKVVLLLSTAAAAADKSMVAIDTSASRLTRFADAAGNSLLDDEKPFMGFGVFPKISKDAKHAAIEIHAPRLPETG